MDSLPTLQSVLDRPTPVLVLAPMQDVTDLPFWRLMARYGGPDIYYTEYFRVHGTSRIEPWILNSITENYDGASHTKNYCSYAMLAHRNSEGQRNFKINFDAQSRVRYSCTAITRAIFASDRLLVCLKENES